MLLSRSFFIVYSRRTASDPENSFATFPRFVNV